MALPKMYVNISMSIVGSTTAMRSASTSRTEWMKLREMKVDSAVSAPRRGRAVAIVVMSSLRFEEFAGACVAGGGRSRRVATGDREEHVVEARAADGDGDTVASGGRCAIELVDRGPEPVDAAVGRKLEDELAIGVAEFDDVAADARL